MLTREEATRLLAALAPHQRQLMRFALATGLRQSNVLHLKWSQVDFERRTAWIHADEAKAREAIGVPLNDEAMAVLGDERGKHPTSVFTFNRRPLKSVNTKAWKKGLKRAGIENSRWHRFAPRLGHLACDGRHQLRRATGARRVEVGTMVKRYSHFAPEQLRRAADRTR